MPKGFAAPANPIKMSLVYAAANFPSCSYEASQSLGTDNTYNSKGYLGWRFQEKDQDNDNCIKP